MLQASKQQQPKQPLSGIPLVLWVGAGHRMSAWWLRVDAARLTVGGGRTGGLVRLVEKIEKG